MPNVTLKGGPFDGAIVNVKDGHSLVCDIENDRVARYRPGRDKSTYTFRGFDTVIARLPPVADEETKP